jgi:hypothetical protein
VGRLIELVKRRRFVGAACCADELVTVAAASIVPATAIAAVTSTAATATTASITTAAAAITTAATAAAKAASALRTILARTSFIHGQVAAVEVFAVERFDSFLSVVFIFHGHEAEAAGAAGHAVHTGP